MPGKGKVWAPLALLLVVACGAPASAVGSVAAPDPGGNERANLRLPAKKGKVLGVNGTFEIPGTTPGAILDRLRNAGMNAARRTLSWNAVEPLRDLWDEEEWSRVADFYRAALREKMTPVLGLGFAPPWARDFPNQLCAINCTYPPARSLVGEWAEFAAEAARRFPRATLELWNEPNAPVFWKPKPDPGRWAELVVAGYDAIKRISPSTRVIICGCAGTIVGGKAAHGLPLDTFLDRAYEHRPSIKGHHDGISWHFFPQAYGARKPFKFGSGSAFARLIKGVRDVVAKHGEAKTKMWIDEVGYWTDDIKPYAGGVPVSEGAAAKALAKFARRVLTMPDVEAVLVHREIDGPGGPDRYAVRDSSFGLLRRNPLLAPKPAYCAFAAMGGQYELSGCPSLTPPETRIALRSSRERDVRMRLRSKPRPARFECKVNKRSWRGCPARLKLKLKAGRHRMRARAYRRDGTYDRSPAKLTFRVG